MSKLPSQRISMRREPNSNRLLLEEAHTAIERLQEYRTALITAAVTGKVDVRGAAA